jgi:hypothetical protein
MKLRRFSIANLMVVVGIVALNIAATRLWSHSSSPIHLTGRFLTVFALQVGIFYSIRNRRTRLWPFWSAFEAFGLAAALISIYIDFLSSAESELFNPMDLYLYSTYNLLESLATWINDPHYRSKVTRALTSSDNSFTFNFVFEVVSFLPQLVIALTGGCLTGLIVKLWGKRQARVTPGYAAN